MPGRSCWKTCFLPCIPVSSWNSHCWVTTQRGVAQEAVPHCSKCLWPKIIVLHERRAFNLQMHFMKTQGFQLQFWKSNWKKYPALFNWLALSDTSVCTFLAILLWGFPPSVGLVSLKKNICMLDSAEMLSPEVYWPSTSPLNIVHPGSCVEKQIPCH